MLITNDVLKNRYTGDGRVTQFPLTFPFFDGAHVAVFTSEAGLPVVRVNPTDYTIVGAGNPAGGTCTFKVAPPAELSIALVRDVPITQLHKYTELDNFPAESHEDALAKLTMICQQLTEEVGRTIKVPVTSDDPPELLAELILEARDQAIESAAEALVSETNAAASAVESAALLEEVKAEHTASLEDIGNARADALANISDARSGAIGAIAAQETDSTLAVNQAGQQQVSAVNSAASNALAAAQQQITGIITEGDTQVQRVKSAGNQARIEVTAEGDVQVQRVSGSANQALVDIKASTIEAAQSAEQAEMYAQQAKDLTGYDLASATNVGIGLKLGNGLERVGDVMNVIGMTILSTPVLEFPVTVAIGHKYVLTMSSTTGIPGAAIQGFTVTVDRRDPVVVLSEPGGVASYEITIDGLDLEDGEIVVTATDSVGNDSKQGRHAYSKRAVTIVAPRVLSPLDGDVDVPLKPEVAVGAFVATGMPDTPASTRLLVYNGDEVVYDTGHIGYFTSHKVTTELPDLKDLTFVAEHAGNIYGGSGPGPAVVATTIKKGILPAAILSPPNGAMDQAVNVAIALNAIRVTGIEASPAGTKVIVYSDEERTTPVFTYDGAYTLTVPTAGLPVKTELWAVGAHKDGVLGWADMSEPVHFTTLNAAVNKPVILSPLAGSVTEGLSVPVMLSEFSNIGPIDSPKATDIRILDMTGEVVARYTGAYTTSHTFDSSLFAVNTGYIVDAEHEGNTWGKSQRSDPIAFKTVDAAVLAPAILSPADGEVDVSLTPTIALSPFSNVGPEDTPKGTRVRVYSDDALTTLVAEYNGVYTTSWAVSPALAVDSSFWAVAEHEGVLWGLSPTSAKVGFKTAAISARRPTLLMPKVVLRKGKAELVTNDFEGVLVGHSSTDWKIEDMSGNILASVESSQDKLAHAFALNWTSVVAVPGQPNNWQDVTYGNGKFVAVGYAGRTSTSLDGVTWTNAVAVSGQTGYWRGVTYGNGKFVAVGDGGRTSTSLDGVTWTNAVAVSGQTGTWYGATYGNGKFVVVGDVGKTTTSLDGVTWTNAVAVSGRNSHWQDVTYGNGKFVAVGYEGRTSTSLDGTTWTPEVAVSGQNSYWYGVTYGNGKFVAVGYEGLTTTSLDGVTWTPLVAVSGQPGHWQDVTYGNGKFVAVGDYGRTTTSLDGETWTSVVAVPGQESYWQEVAYGNGKFVAVGDGGKTTTIEAFIDAGTRVKCSARWRGSAEWANAVAVSGQTNAWQDVTYGNGKFVAVGVSGLTTTSLDGETWTNAVVAVSGQTNIWFGVTYGNGKFVAVGDGGKTSTSLDGTTWTPLVVVSGQTNAWNGATYGNGKFVVVGHSGRTSTSLDGVTWTTAVPVSGQNSPWYGVTYGNGKFVAVGAYGRTSTSLDGETWTNAVVAVSGQSYDWYGVTYGNGKFVAVGYGGKTSTSLDGVTWTNAVAVSGQTNIWYGVTYGNGKFVAVGDYGRTTTSLDGETWTSVVAVPGQTYAWLGVTYGNGKFVAVGDVGKTTTIDESLISYIGIPGPWSEPEEAVIEESFLVAIGNGGLTSTSLDGVTWTPLVAVSGQTSSWRGVTYGNGKFVAVGDGGRTSTSLDGLTWTNAVAVSGQESYWLGVTYGNGKFVAVGNSGLTTTSLDGETWTNVVTPPGQTSFWTGVTYGNGKFVAVGNSGLTTTSLDGETWTNVVVAVSGQTGTWLGVTYGNGKFVAIGHGGLTTTSLDGVTWTPVVAVSGQLNYWQDVAYGNGKFVAVGYGGRTSTSLDGVTWTNAVAVSGQTGVWNGVTYGNGKFVAVGEVGKTSASLDGVTWTSAVVAVPGLKYFWWDATYA